MGLRQALAEALDQAAVPPPPESPADIVLDWTLGFEGALATGCSPWTLIHAVGEAVRRVQGSVANSATPANHKDTQQHGDGNEEQSTTTLEEEQGSQLGNDEHREGEGGQSR